MVGVCNGVVVRVLWGIFECGSWGLMLLGCFKYASFMLLGRSCVGVV